MPRLTLRLLLLLLLILPAPISIGQKTQANSKIQNASKETAVQSAVKRKPSADVELELELESAADAKAKAALLGKLKELYGKVELDIKELKKTVEPEDSASGVKVFQTDEVVVIDVTPCSKEKVLVTFHRTYKESSVSDAECDDQKFSRVKVTQK